MVHVRVVVVGAIVALLAVLGFFAVRWNEARAFRPSVSTVASPVSVRVARDDSLTGPAVLTAGSIRRSERPVVVLVHGLGRRPASMAPLGRGLVGSGFRVVNLGYPSWTTPADSLVTLLADSVGACCSEAGPDVNFVTHSLGGILVRKYLEEYSPDHTGRVVMLSPPNGGSEIIDFVQTVPGLRGLLGPTGSELGTDSTSLPNLLGPARFQLGVITGDRSLNPIYSWLIPGPDDGKVGVERARVDGADQFLVVPFSHSFIMNRQPVVDEISSFLTRGSFSDEALASWGYDPPARSDPSVVDTSIVDTLIVDTLPTDSVALEVYSRFTR